jgi:catechol 2,3-dioxygenase-like lactoylglutathione lyase family enzyme
MALHRLVSLTMGVPDVAAAAAFYREFGLAESTSGVFATTSGGDQLRLVAAPRRGLVELAVGVDDADDLGRIAAALARIDVASERTPSALLTRDPASGIPLRVAVAPRLVQPAEPPVVFNGPGRVARSGRAPAVLTEAPVRPRKLGHVVHTTRDLAASHRFWVDAIGFRVSDELPGLGWFLRCSTDHHNLLIQAAPAAFLHHTAWEVADVDEVGRGATRMLATDPSRHGWGFGRHHVGSNFFWYLRDPAGTFCEYYSDLDVIAADDAWTPERWEGARGLFTWGPPPPMSFLVPDDLATFMEG